MDPATLVEQSATLADKAAKLAEDAATLAQQATQLAVPAAGSGGGDPFLFLFTVFVLAVFVGFYVVWSVTPARRALCARQPRPSIRSRGPHPADG